MAKYRGKIYLGYEEDVVTDKGVTQLNYTINKIGGAPVRLPAIDLYEIKLILSNG